jgi:hypothetical protein
VDADSDDDPSAVLPLLALDASIFLPGYPQEHSWSLRSWFADALPAVQTAKFNAIFGPAHQIRIPNAIRLSLPGLVMNFNSWNRLLLPSRFVNDESITAMKLLVNFAGQGKVLAFDSFFLEKLRTGGFGVKGSNKEKRRSTFDELKRWHTHVRCLNS